jgi:hypothetical protein
MTGWRSESESSQSPFRDLNIVASAGPIHVAGEHTSLKHGWIEGAIESVVRAGLEVHAWSFGVPCRKERRAWR